MRRTDTSVPGTLQGDLHVDHVLDWLNSRDEGTRITALAGTAGAALVLVTFVAFAVPSAATIAGAIAGVALFMASFGAWHTVLNEDQQDATDVKARYPLRQRRLIVAAAAVVWVALLLVVGPHVPAAIAGTVNVWVVCSLVWVVRATPTEAAAARAAYDAAVAARQAEAEAAAPDADFFDEWDTDYGTGPRHQP